ncbi:tRNA uridine-5-carboxymethylaminomethyl(34) synthesis GTPase MnmE [Lutispora thermophila]|uniref:tRNA modification GTPase MnmE n=1 Tax=Lutispora thermophila DSM 19022 TaxID=1122184 RepID=A0A1M6HYY7_9FIRM|nr:tRNA uridine-5-carboxymethylaminomethyl(34) synthesis GTPase MnmE [Lutispora thermophila]SHJ27402.1 tRNA modification GTPase trmE [Lutispora thermophila DSM 19022]
MLDDTIAAVGTAPGEAGIGIIRLSGKRSQDILGQIFRGKKAKDVNEMPSRYMSYGFIYDEEGKKIDEVLAVIMRAPYSYTGEDVVEIHCHGGVISIRKIMELVLKKGARLAEAGEFTKRGFLNGRIDLAQSEAVIDIITAKTDEGLENAVNQLQGELSLKVKEVMDKLMSMLAHIEASIDFPEHDIEEVTSENLKSQGNEALGILKELQDTYYEGKIQREGLSTAIIGRPNVGKSSLLNLLLRENRAIVTDIPGTTRDIIEEYLNVKGVLIKLIDTAGLRETEDVVEKIGVEKTKEALNRADLVIFIVDASKKLTEEDMAIASMIKQKKVIVAANKIDAGIEADLEALGEIFDGHNIIKMSVKDKKGIDLLEEAIYNTAYSGNVKSKSSAVVSNIRHKSLIDKAVDSIEKAMEAIDEGIPVDLISVDIKDAWRYLGEITGDTVEEDIITEIFSRFCIGK